MTTSNETICTQHGRASTYILHVHKVNTINKSMKTIKKIVQQKEQQHQHIDENHQEIDENHRKKSTKPLQTIKKPLNTIEKQWTHPKSTKTIDKHLINTNEKWRRAVSRPKKNKKEKPIPLVSGTDIIGYC